jgi:tetratricopeptide (TPR) repeat protein
MARVFISHASGDAETAAELKAWLDAAGFTQTFLDFDRDSGIPPGADWERKLYAEINRSQAMVLILTPRWFDSKWCFHEFRSARALGKAVFPLIVTPSDDARAAPDIQHVDLTRDKDGGLEWLRRELVRIGQEAQGGFDFPRDRDPYPGLPAFTEAEAAVYFGRDDDIRRMLEWARAHVVRGGPKLVPILGVSGVGKSSFLQAGVLPRLKRNGAEWVALPPFRPGADPLRAFGEACRAHGAPADLAAIDSPEAARDLIDRLRAAAPQAHLVIAIDQGEELFTRASAERRRAFMALLSRLLADDAPVLALMTLRADHFGDLQAAEGLTAAFEAFSLAPLQLERMASIVEGPARVVGAEVDDALASALARDARDADALPLVALALRRLWDAAEVSRKNSRARRLAIADYERLRDGVATPLDAIVRDTAERSVALLGPTPEEITALRETFVQALVKVNDDGVHVRQTAALDALPPAARRLVGALVDARLFVAGAEDGRATVEVAHEALFRAWPRLAGWLAEERDFLIGKRRIEVAHADWAALTPPERPRGLLTGLPLVRARDWYLRHPARFPADEAAFIRASIAADDAQTQARETARRRGMRWLAAGLVCAVMLAVGAGWQWREAETQRAAAERNAAAARDQESRAETARATAERNFSVARATVDRMITNVVQGFTGVDGVSADLMNRVITEARAALNQLQQAAPDDLELQHSRSVLLSELGMVLRRKGDAESARIVMTESLEIARALVALDQVNTRWRLSLAASLIMNGDHALSDNETDRARMLLVEAGDALRHAAGAPASALAANEQSLVRVLIRLGDTLVAAGDAVGAREAFAESVDVARRLVAKRPDDAGVQDDLSVGLTRSGNQMMWGGDVEAALAALAEAVALDRRRLAAAPRDTQRLSGLSFSLDLLSDALHRAGRRDEARQAFAESLELLRRAAAGDPAQADLQSGLVGHLRKLSDRAQLDGDAATARAAAAESVEIRRRLVAAWPGDAARRHDLSMSLATLGQTLRWSGDKARAKEAFAEMLDIVRRLSEAEPASVAWRQHLINALHLQAEIAWEDGDAPGAQVAIAQSLEIGRRRAAAHPDRPELSRNLGSALGRIGDLARSRSDSAGARAAYAESLAVAREVAASPRALPNWQADISNALRRLGDLAESDGDTAAARAAFTESLDITRRLAASDPAFRLWRQDINDNLLRLGDLAMKADDVGAARTFLQERLDSTRELAAASPGNWFAQRDLVLSLNRISRLAQNEGRIDEARTASAESLAIARQVVVETPGALGLQIDLGFAIARMAAVVETADEQRALWREARDLLRRLDAAGALQAEERRLLDDAVARLATLGVAD